MMQLHEMETWQYGVRPVTNPLSPVSLLAPAVTSRPLQRAQRERRGTWRGGGLLAEGAGLGAEGDPAVYAPQPRNKESKAAADQRRQRAAVRRRLEL